MKKITVILFLVFYLKSYSQVNLVPNPSFEDTLTCPIYSGIDEFVIGWTNPNDYSPDYFNSCANINTPNRGIPSNGYGYQEARTGNAYCGIYIPVNSGNSLREYIQAELTEPLDSGVEYSVKFYVSLAENHSDYSVNTLGAYLSVSAISSSSLFVFNVNPQIVNDPIANPLIDKNNWQEVSGTFVASGGEKFITIGNFEDDATVDTISLVAVPSISDKSYYYIDDVSVKSTLTNINKYSIEHIFNYYPNPVSDILNIELKNIGNYDIIILDVTGNVIINQKNINGFYSINVSNYPNGIYFLQLSKENNLITNKKIIINH